MEKKIFLLKNITSSRNPRLFSSSSGWLKNEKKKCSLSKSFLYTRDPNCWEGGTYKSGFYGGQDGGHNGWHQGVTSWQNLSRQWDGGNEEFRFYELWSPEDTLEETRLSRHARSSAIIRFGRQLGMFIPCGYFTWPKRWFKPVIYNEWSTNPFHPSAGPSLRK